MSLTPTFIIEPNRNASQLGTHFAIFACLDKQSNNLSQVGTHSLRDHSLLSVWPFFAISFLYSDGDIPFSLRNRRLKYSASS